MNKRLDLAPFHFDTAYRPGRYNEAADAFTRIIKKSSKSKILAMANCINSGEFL